MYNAHIKGYPVQTLEDIIRDEIQSGGAITFARFMELALYHPEHGYYGGGAGIGKAGDFYTSPHVSPVFGKLIAEIYLKLKAALSVEHCAFVEMGAGEGYFAKDFLEGLHRYHEREYQRCEYIIVERSPGMAARQQETLGRLRDKVQWYGRVEDLPCPVTGIFFSNELVDSFPVHRVRRDRDSIKEIYVNHGGKGFMETLGPLSSPLIARHFNRIGLNLPEGITTEVNLRAGEWARSVSEGLVRGFVITIDYGYPAHEYYIPDRCTGTLACYHRHTVNENPFTNVGEQDITAHVDFTSLAHAGREAGLNPVLYTDQTSFLAEALGLLHKAMSACGPAEEELAEAGLGIKTLVHPEWMGETFKVLVQSKGAGREGVFGGIKDRTAELFKPGESGSVRFY